MDVSCRVSASRHILQAAYSTLMYAGVRAATSLQLKSSTLFQRAQECCSLPVHRKPAQHGSSMLWTTIRHLLEQRMHTCKSLLSCSSMSLLQLECPSIIITVQLFNSSPCIEYTQNLNWAVSSTRETGCLETDTLHVVTGLMRVHCEYNHSINGHMVFAGNRLGLGARSCTFSTGGLCLQWRASSPCSPPM